MLPELMALFDHGIDFFSEAITSIQHVTDNQISEIITMVPEEYLNSGQREHIKSMLSYRRDNLYNKVEEACRQRGGAE
jgi:hypothetical protein